MLTLIEFLEYSFRLLAKHPICFFSVYLPTGSGCSEEFRDCLDLLDSSFSSYSPTLMLSCWGDFNADIGNCGLWSSTLVNKKHLSAYLAAA